MLEWNRRHFLRGLSTGVWLSGGCGIAVAGPDGKEVACRITEGHSRRPVSARVRLTDARGNDVVPLGHPTELAADAQQGDVRFQSKRFAYVDGNFSVDPNSLPLQYQVIKGYEFAIAEGRISAEILREGGIEIQLPRWSSLADRGWY